MSHRYTLAEFPDLIRREGGLVPLFTDTRVRPEEAPIELQVFVAEANFLVEEFELKLTQIAEACGYDPEDG